MKGYVVKIKNSEIWASREPLQALVEMKLPAKVSYHLAKLVRKIDPEYQIIEQVRNDLVKKYGEQQVDDKGEPIRGNIAVNPDMKGWSAFFKEFTEILEQEVELEFNVVKIPEMVDGKTLEIEAKVLIPLMTFVEVEEQNLNNDQKQT